MRCKDWNGQKLPLAALNRCSTTQILDINASYHAAGHRTRPRTAQLKHSTSKSPQLKEIGMAKSDQFSKASCRIQWSVLNLTDPFAKHEIAYTYHTSYVRAKPGTINIGSEPG
jgi:hypothetical protein